MLAPALAALIMTRNSLETGIAKIWRKVRRRRRAKFTLQERDIGGLKAWPLGRPGRAFRCPELRLELNWLRLLASNTHLDLLCMWGPTEV